MAHFAWLNADHIVYRVCKVDNEHLLDENGDEQEHLGIAYLKAVHSESRRPARWVQTSYNAEANGFRGKFAGFGDIYDDALDVFITPKKNESEMTDE